jgi:predicted TIM-barrel fold metal-dependent hydrolase
VGATASWDTARWRTLVNGYSQIGNADNAIYLDLPQFRPFWREMERLDVPFYLHPRYHCQVGPISPTGIRG